MLAFILGFLGCLIIVRVVANIDIAAPFLLWLNVKPAAAAALQERREPKRRKRQPSLTHVTDPIEQRNLLRNDMDLALPPIRQAVVQPTVKEDTTTDEDSAQLRASIQALKERTQSRSATQESIVSTVNDGRLQTSGGIVEHVEDDSSSSSVSSSASSPTSSTEAIRSALRTSVPNSTVATVESQGSQCTALSIPPPKAIISPTASSAQSIQAQSKKLLFTGWMQVRSKLTVVPGKFTWHKRYVILREDGWMSWYKDDRVRSKECYGYIFLKECNVSQKIKDISQSNCKPQPRSYKLIIEHSDKRLVHRHGPDPSDKRISRTRNFTVRGKKMSFKCSDEASIRNWIRYINMGIESANKSLIPTMMEEKLVDSAGDMQESTVAVPEPAVPVVEEIAPLQSEIPAPVIQPLEAPAGVPQLVTSQAVNISRSASSSSVSGPQLRARGALRKSKEFSITDVTLSSEETEEEVTDSENRKGLLKEFTKNAMGAELFRISLPVSLNEPLSFLQRMCEQVAYYELLHEAAACEDPCHRLLYVAIFAISQYSSERTTKPFNPLLGETFEFVDDNKIKFMAEQVSHHPPVGASYAESDNFAYYQDLGIKTKFGGNSIPCEEVGSHNLILTKTGDKFSWPGIKTVVHNVIIGRMWLDHFGEMEITNTRTGDRAKIVFSESGWFGKGRYEVSGQIFDAEGKTRIAFKGKRNEYIDATVILGSPLQKPNPVWKHDKLQHEQNNPWKMNTFVQNLNYIDSFLNETLPETDSRFRPDRMALEKQDMKRAAAEKRLLEQKQRDQAKARAQSNKQWVPKHFDQVEENGKTYWKYKNLYWQERERRIAQYSQSN